VNYSCGLHLCVIAILAKLYHTYMMKVKYVAFFLSVFSLSTLYAQQNPAGQVYRTYHTAIELLDKGKYVAAAEQFRLGGKIINKNQHPARF
jgi:starvation-inducible outer membrane lipoprotein